MHWHRQLQLFGAQESALVEPAARGGFVTIVCIGFGWLQPTGGTQYHSAVMLGIRTFAVVNDQQRLLDELRCGLRMVRVKCKHEIVYTWTHESISRI